MAEAGDISDTVGEKTKSEKSSRGDNVDSVPLSSLRLNEEEEKKAAEFHTTIQQHVYGGFITLGLALGSQLGIFDELLSNIEPMASAELAEKTECKERYVEELMRMMVCGDIVDFTVTDAGINLYFIPVWKRESLKGSLHGCFYVPLLAAPYSKLVNCFTKHGPTGLDFKDVQPAFEMWKGGRESFFKICVQELPKQLPRTDKFDLDDGANCLDIGCCDGEFFLQLAQEYPKSTFLGVDNSPALIETAIEDSVGFRNLAFQEQNAKKLPSHWTAKFNVIFIVETLHDLPFPRETLRECFRILAPGGVLSVVDINISSSLAEQKKQPFGAVSTYAFSLYHCLSTALGNPRAEGLGTCVGIEAMTKMIQEEGFDNVQVKQIPGNHSCQHFVAQKSTSL